MHKNGVSYLSDLYKRIDDVCKKLDISVTEMCRRASVPRGNLSDLKMGRQKSLSAENLQKVANVLGVTTGYLLGTETKKEPTSDEADELVEVTAEYVMSLFEKLTDEEKKEVFSRTAKEIVEKNLL